MSVEDGSDELWVAVKCQSNLEIAGSPRNALRCSRTPAVAGGGRALVGRGGFTAYQLRLTYECQERSPTE